MLCCEQPQRAIFTCHSHCLSSTCIGKSYTQYIINTVLNAEMQGLPHGKAEAALETGKCISHSTEHRLCYA